MPLTYPPLPPDYLRNLTPPTYGVKTFTFEDGGEARDLRYSDGVGTQILLQYTGASASEWATILNFYRACRGSFTSFTLPGVIIQHPLAYTVALSQLGATTLWKFNNQPTPETNVVNLYSFDVQLISVRF